MRTENVAKQAKGTSSKQRKAAAKSAPKGAAAGAGPGAGAKRGSAAGARRIDERIRSLGDWRGEALAEVRRLIHEADPDIVEECKWIKPGNPLGVAVWSHPPHGIVCTGETYKQVVKLTFARGAALEKLQGGRGLFNSSLDGNTRRAIDIREGEALDAEGFKALIRAAIAENPRKDRLSGAKPKSGSKAARSRAAGAGAKRGKVIEGRPAREGALGEVVLLSGGNPQIAKGEGDGPVQAYIAAVPGWKRGLGKRLDGLIVRNAPNVRKAVKWNSPFYGIEGQGWFVSFHVFTRYVKVTFFRGTSLRPIPPGGTGKDARWIDIHEDDLDEAQMAGWIEQAARLPGWDGGRSS